MLWSMGLVAVCGNPAPATPTCTYLCSSRKYVWHGRHQSIHHPAAVAVDSTYSISYRSATCLAPTANDRVHRRRRDSLRRKHHSIVSGHFSAVGSDSWGIAGRCADQAIARRPGPAAGGCAHCGSHWEEALCWMEHVNENEKKSEKTASSAALPCAACLAAARTLRIYWRSQRRLRGFWMCTQSMYNYIPPCVALLPAPDCRGSRSM